MKRLLLVFCALAFSVSFADAQSPTPLCFNSTGSGGNQYCQPVDANNPFPVTSSIIPGAATAANQSLEIAALNTIIAQALSAGTAGTPSTQVVTVQGISGGKGLPISSGASGTPSQTTVSVTNSSTTLVTAAQFANFIKVCISQTASTGIWVNWAGAAAVTAAPSQYMPPGECDTWVAAIGYMPTSQVNAISNSSSTIAVTLIGG